MEELKLILMVGLPLSGKSTWARKQGHPIVNPDSIRLALHGQRFYGDAEPFVWAIAYLMVDALFKAGHRTVIVDSTNITEKRRRPWFDKFKDCNVVLEIIETSHNVCTRRAEQDHDLEILPIIDKMANDWDLEIPIGGVRRHTVDL